MRSTLTIGIICAMVIGSAPARADQPTPLALARRYYKKGRLHYTRGEFEKAVQAFKTALRHNEHPSILFSIGQCHRQLKQWNQALFFFKLYLDKKPDAANKQEVKGFIRDLVKRVAAAARLARFGRVTVVTKPQGARIFVDSFKGRGVATSPAMIKLAVGQHVLEIRKLGYTSIFRKVTVQPGKIVLLQLTLAASGTAPPPRPGPRPREEEWIPEPLPEAGSQATPGPGQPTTRARTAPPPPLHTGHETGPGPGPAPGPGPLPPATRDTSPPPKPFYSSWWFYTGIVFGVTMIGIGAALDKKADELKEDEDPDRQEEGQNFHKAAIASYVIGPLLLAGVAIGAIVNGLALRKQKKRASLQILPGCGPHGCTLSVRAEF